MSAPHPIRPCAEFPNDNEDLHAGSRWLSVDVAGPVTAVLPEVPSVAFEAAPLTQVRRAMPEVHDTSAVQAAVVPDAPEGIIAVLEEHALDAIMLQHIELGGLESDAEDPFLAELAPFVEHMARALLPANYREETPTQKLRPVNQATQPLVPLHFELTPLPPDTSEWAQLTTVLTDHLLTSGHTRAAALITPLLNAELVDLSRLESSVLEQLKRDGVATPRGSRLVSSASFRSSAHVFREELSNGGLDTNEAMFWLTQLVGSLIGNDDDQQLEQTLRNLGVASLLERAA